MQKPCKQMRPKSMRTHSACVIRVGCRGVFFAQWTRGRLALHVLQVLVCRVLDAYTEMLHAVCVQISVIHVYVLNRTIRPTLFTLWFKKKHDTSLGFLVWQMLGFGW